MSESSYIKKVKTPEGTVLSLYQEPGKNAKLHSLAGPAIKYPKDSKKKDVYAIYGREMSKREWLILKNDSKVITPLPDML
jgi:hypothetical protein